MPEPETQIVQFHFTHGQWSYYAGDVIDAETMDVRGLDADAFRRFRLRGALKTQAEIDAEAVAAQAAAPMPAEEPAPLYPEAEPQA